MIQNTTTPSSLAISVIRSSTLWVINISFAYLINFLIGQLIDCFFVWQIIWLNDCYMDLFVLLPLSDCKSNHNSWNLCPISLKTLIFGYSVETLCMLSAYLLVTCLGWSAEGVLVHSTDICFVLTEQCCQVFTVGQDSCESVAICSPIVLNQISGLTRSKPILDVVCLQKVKEWGQF